MKSTFDAIDAGLELRSALVSRAEAEGRPVAEVVRTILSDALSVPAETPAERWRRENADAIAAYNEGAEERLAKVHSMSAVPIPRFKAGS